MPQKPLPPSPRLPEGNESNYNNKQFQHGKEHIKGCPRGSCSGPILWNIQYDPILNLQFTHHTRPVAFADDLILMIRADSIREAENIANVEIDKIAIWADNSKTRRKTQRTKRGSSMHEQ